VKDSRRLIAGLFADPGLGETNNRPPADEADLMQGHEQAHSRYRRTNAAPDSGQDVAYWHLADMGVAGIDVRY
jgi:hypothetical protein